MTSLQSKLIKLLAKIFKINSVWTKQGSELEILIKKKQCDVAKPSKAMYKKYNIEIHSSFGYPMYTLCSRTKESSKTVMYLPGGGFVLPISSLHWAFIDNLMKNANINVIVPLYPLAPKNNIDDVMNYLLDIYQKIIKNKGELTIMGDSAGATISLAFIQLLKEQELHFPKQVIAISPLVDLELQNPQIEVVQKRDPITAIPALKDIRKSFAGNRSLTDVLLSPMKGDFDQTTNIIVFSGTDDITNPDTREMINQNPSHFQYYEYQGMMHVFPLFPIPEGKRAKRQIESLLK
ncbi:Monoterpene epsilon-lactone hydrolase [Peribacillus sp. Bi96]|uniref:alpha/beta hydrolase n=1 Tax=unclassified Peribacillus TaxID=2675266 RepID=UPI001D50E5A8|nr:alpha/beta hydrolase [Peribacillus sp. Bi96]CAH0313631.1 Monoterpene epsilon-lactone hydrolase [Peribacillus sp. Bi96]